MSEPADLTTWLGRIGAAGLGLLLLFAAFTKAIDPAAFAEQIEAEGLTGLIEATPMAFAALALETGLGVLLLLQVRRWWVLAPTAGLALFFLFLTGRAYWRALRGAPLDEASCGCFGNVVDRSPAEAFWQDLALLLIPLALAILGRCSGPLPSRRLVGAAVAVVAVLGLAWRAPALPLDDLATRVAPGDSVSSMCAGRNEGRVCLTDLAPELHEGEQWVVLLDLGAATEGDIERLNRLAFAGTPLTVLTEASPEEVTAFTWNWGPAFGLAEVPKALLRPMYRRRPRSFELRNGIVVTTWDSLPPETTEDDRGDE